MKNFASISLVGIVLAVGGTPLVAHADVQLYVSLHEVDAVSSLQSDFGRVADAIWRAEGGDKTKWPYGVKSVHTTNPRQVCLNTIRHAWHDWVGRQVALPDTHSLTPLNRAFIYFLADRYCPPSDDRIGNQRWKKNVTSILKLK